MINKKLLFYSLSLLLSLQILVGCSSNKSTSSTDTLKVGMVTNSGTIEDKSFNQGTWEGITKAKENLGIQTAYLKPNGTTEAEYLKEISNLRDAGYKFIVTPGFKFESAIYQSQARYPDCKFVLLDGSPSDGTSTHIADNTVSIFFAEDEAGFLAGVATALEQQTGEVGFLGGMKIPAIVRFESGFSQGIAYANENLNTSVHLDPSNSVYQGSFDNVPAGQQIAAQLYDKGVQTIFCAAGDVGIGAITEAKSRVQKGQAVWVVGVDVDQYAEGLYADGKSVVLTSAVKKIDTSTYDMIAAELAHNFPGGQTLIFNVQNDGVGLPAENPNLSTSTLEKVKEVYTKLQQGQITLTSE